MKLRWSDSPDGSRQCASRDQLEHALRELAAHPAALPILALIETRDHYIVIGVGRPEVPLTIGEDAADGVRSEWISVGDPERPGFEDFSLLGHHSQCESRQLIPFETALKAALMFAESGQRSPDVEWEENSY